MDSWYCHVCSRWPAITRGRSLLFWASGSQALPRSCCVAGAPGLAGRRWPVVHVDPHSRWSGAGGPEPAPRVPAALPSSTLCAFVPCHFCVHPSPLGPLPGTPRVFPRPPERFSLLMVARVVSLSQAWQRVVSSRRAHGRLAPRPPGAGFVGGQPVMYPPASGHCWQKGRKCSGKEPRPLPAPKAACGRPLWELGVQDRAWAPTLLGAGLPRASSHTVGILARPPRRRAPGSRCLPARWSGYKGQL